MISDEEKAALIPQALAIAAWVDGPTAATPLNPQWGKWVSRLQFAQANRFMPAEEPVDEREWKNPHVGWGLLVADNDNATEADRAVGKDLPAVMQALLAHRQGVVLRYRPESGGEFLRRYYVDGKAQDLAIITRAGVGRNEVPRYLLIWDPPGENAQFGKIPWRVQYSLQGTRYVGRLHLQGRALENYVNAAIEDWAGSTIRADSPVVWAVDHADSDITHLMRRVVAEPVEKKLRGDTAIGEKIRYVSSAQARVSELIAALAQPERSPAFVLTSSHGMTGPLDDLATMAATLGLLVDQNGDRLDPAALLAKWQPDGAIWYAHACCSAGSDNSTQFGGLVGAGPVKDVLEGVAKLGATVAPLPTALLGADRPLRAFVGHVEPTFDWTLRHPETGQVMTHALSGSLYDGMHRTRPEPVGMAFKRWHEQAGQLFSFFHTLQNELVSVDPDVRLRARAAALRTQLAALDRQSCVILGDPAVALPALPQAPGPP